MILIFHECGAEKELPRSEQAENHRADEAENRDDHHLHHQRFDDVYRPETGTRIGLNSAARLLSRCE